MPGDNALERAIRDARDSVFPEGYAFNTGTGYDFRADAAQYGFQASSDELPEEYGFANTVPGPGEYTGPCVDLNP